MKKIIKTSTLLLAGVLLLSSCTNISQKAYLMKEWDPIGLLSIDNESPIGVIKRLDKNNAEDKMESSVLLAHLHEMTGDIALAKVNILGEVEGKIYTFNVYASYSKENGKAIRKEIKQEFAAFTSYDQEDYESQKYDTAEDILEAENFLPESLRQNDIDTFDRYVYAIGEATNELQTEAEEYFIIQ